MEWNSGIDMSFRSGPRSRRLDWRTFQVRQLGAFVSALLALVLTLTLGACAGAAASSGSTHSRSVITAAELSAAGSESVYDLISRARPEFFREKPSQKYSEKLANGDQTVTAERPALIVNGQRAGDFGDLHTIPASTLSGVRYYSIEEAKRKFGMQFGGGAIELTYATPRAP
jgi:hypothetical protein